jgi:hypothetical protein
VIVARRVFAVRPNGIRLTPHPSEEGFAFDISAMSARRKHRRQSAYGVQKQIVGLVQPMYTAPQGARFDHMNNE